MAHKEKIFWIVCALAAALGVALIALMSLSRAYEQQASSAPVQDNTIYSTTDFLAADDVELCSRSELVMYGKVKQQYATDRLKQVDPDTGATTDSEMPETQWKVERNDIAGHNLIKGSVDHPIASNQIVVNQIGGYDANNQLALLEGDALLQANKHYLFFLNYNSDASRYELAAQPEGAVQGETNPEQQSLYTRFNAACSEAGIEGGGGDLEAAGVHRAEANIGDADPSGDTAEPHEDITP
jgi:hypothetical protein